MRNSDSRKKHFRTRGDPCSRPPSRRRSAASFHHPVLLCGGHARRYRRIRHQHDRALRGGCLESTHHHAELVGQRCRNDRGRDYRSSGHLRPRPCARRPFTARAVVIFYVAAGLAGQPVRIAAAVLSRRLLRSHCTARRTPTSLETCELQLFVHHCSPGESRSIVIGGADMYRKLNLLVLGLMVVGGVARADVADERIRSYRKRLRRRLITTRNSRSSTTSSVRQGRGVTLSGESHDAVQTGRHRQARPRGRMGSLTSRQRQCAARLELDDELRHRSRGHLPQPKFWNYATVINPQFTSSSITGG